MNKNSLRRAAYLLIAHFVLITGISLLGKAPLDYVRVVMSLGFLIGGVAALFWPSKMGWVMVLL